MAWQRKLVLAFLNITTHGNVVWSFIPSQQEVQGSYLDIFANLNTQNTVQKLFKSTNRYPGIHGPPAKNKKIHK